MKANIFSHEHLTATTDLKVGDKSMGCVYSEFYPNEYYFEHIQKS